MNNEEPPSSESGKSNQNVSWLERLGQAFSGTEPQNTEQLLTLLKAAAQRELIDQHALKMIEGVFDVFENRRVREIMVPRAQMAVINRTDSYADIVATVTQSGHSRFPVIGEDRDQVVGVLLAKDLLKFAGQSGRFNIDSVLRNAVLIPESKRLNTLLNEFRATRNHMALVVDEYGGISGLVTIEDVLEVIVGEIDDEFDIENSDNIFRHHLGHFYVNALTEIDEFNTYFNTHLDSDSADTVGGYVMQHLGYVPKRGEQFEVEDLVLTVLGVDSRRIYRFKVTRAA